MGGRASVGTCGTKNQHKLKRNANFKEMEGWMGGEVLTVGDAVCTMKVADDEETSRSKGEE